MNHVTIYPQSYTFKGSTFDPAKDQKRLTRQYDRVLAAAKSAEWFTLGWMSARTGAPEASVSARLRDFRRAGYTVERRRVPIENGLWEYRLAIQRELFDGEGFKTVRRQSAPVPAAK